MADTKIVWGLKEKYKRRFGSEYFDNAYVEDAECSNCGNKEQFWIRKGIPKPTTPFKCERCGCETMKVL